MRTIETIYGLDWFKADTDDQQENQIFERFGLQGVGMLHLLKREIFGENGYYVSWNIRNARWYARKWNVSMERLTDLVDYCAEIGIFDPDTKDLFGDLTSRPIQLMYKELGGKDTIHKNDLLLTKEELERFEQKPENAGD